MTIETMKQWLEALEYLSTQVKADYETTKAITSLRQAIAEAEKQQTLQALHDENERLDLYEKQESVTLQMDVIVGNLVREGINKHRARELAEHFIKYTRPQPKHFQPEDWSLLEATQESLREYMAKIKELEAQLATQPKQDKQKPVAWMRKPFGEDVEYCEKPFTTDWTPLYTTPQPRKPLTDEQKKSIARRAFKDICKDYPVQDRIILVINDIEAAYGIKE
jgi:hypothetical protein